MNPAMNAELSLPQLLGNVVAELHQPGFGNALFELLRSSVAVDHVVIFAYNENFQPQDLFDNFPASKRRIFVTRYLEGPYLLDPFYQACFRNLEDGLYRLRQLAPDRFYQSEYFRSYYVKTGLAEEVGFCVRLPGDIHVVISLMRTSSSSTFSTREFQRLQQLEPIVRASVQHQWQDLEQRFSSNTSRSERSAIQQSIDHAFRTFGRSLLTPRERVVVEYVLKGHSSEAIARILEISPGTVRIHRKNIYAKLHINSQGELFLRFIAALS